MVAAPYGSLPTRVRIVEVGPRDGWQNLPDFIATGEKISLVNDLAGCGFRELEVTSFVSPRAVPQLRDAAAVVAGLERLPGVAYAALVPNQRGLAQATAAGVDKAVFFISASETHNRENLGRGIEASLAEFAVMMAQRPPTLAVRASVSNVFGCPFEGEVPTVRVVELVRELAGLGIAEITLCDTWGVATPPQVYRVVSQVREAGLGVDLGLHLHDTCGRALAGVMAGLQAGIQRFDTSLGGLGGCPFAPGAAGNLATEDLAACLDAMGVETGIDLPALRRTLQRLRQTVPAVASHMAAFWDGCQG